MFDNAFETLYICFLLKNRDIKNLLFLQIQTSDLIIQDNAWSYPFSDSGTDIMLRGDIESNHGYHPSFKTDNIRVFVSDDNATVEEISRELCRSSSRRRFEEFAKAGLQKALKTPRNTEKHLKEMYTDTTNQFGTFSALKDAYNSNKIAETMTAIADKLSRLKDEAHLILNGSVGDLMEVYRQALSLLEEGDKIQEQVACQALKNRYKLLKTFWTC